MLRIAASMFLAAALTANPGFSTPQMQGGGHQTFVWDSLDSVDPGSGGQPVDGWGFHYYEKDGSHDPSDFEEMTWQPAGIDCGLNAVPACWVADDPQGLDPCCYIAPYVAPIPSCQVQPELEQSSHLYSSVRSWTSPHSGTLAITTPHGNVRKACGSLTGDGSTIRIYRNDLLFFEEKLGPSNTTGFALNESIPVNDGDVLWFHNDGGLDNRDDAVVFLPKLQLTLGTGYDPDLLTTSSFDDFDPDTQGAAGWSYETFDPASETYADMVPCQSTFWVEDQGCGTSVCQIEDDKQHPGTSLYAVRAWTAPQDGWVKLQHRTNVRKVSASDDDVAFEMHYIGVLGNRLLAQELITDTTGVPVGAVVHMRKFDRLELHAIMGPSPAQPSPLIVDVEIELYPGGELPRTLVTMDPPPVQNPPYSPEDVVVGAGDAFWFYEDREINGNLVLDGVPLRVHDGSVKLINTHDTEFAYTFLDGDLTTNRTTIGGGAPDGEASLHSNFNFWPAGNAIWRSLDTIVEHSYGQSIQAFDAANGETAVLTGTRHMMGPNSDFIHVGRGADVSLSESTFGFRLMFPADLPSSVGNTITVALPLNEEFTDYDVDAQFPITDPYKQWDLSLRECTVPYWGLAPYDMTTVSGSATDTIVLDDLEYFFAEMAGNNLSGTVTPLVGPLNSALETFNIRWEPGTNPTEILFWACYFNDSGTNVTLSGGGPSLIAELFATDGARVWYRGTDGLYDAECLATVLKSSGTATNGIKSRLFLTDCKLGTSNAKGQIRAEGGGYIRIDEALLAGDISFEADGTDSAGNPSKIEIVNLTNPNNLFEVTCHTSGGGQIVGCP